MSMEQLRRRRDEFRAELYRRLNEERPDRYCVETSEVDADGNLTRESLRHPESRWMDRVGHEVVEALGLTAEDLTRFRILDLMDEGKSREEIEQTLHEEYAVAELMTP